MRNTAEHRMLNALERSTLVHRPRPGALAPEDRRDRPDAAEAEVRVRPAHIREIEAEVAAEQRALSRREELIELHAAYSEREDSHDWQGRQRCLPVQLR